MATKNGKKNVKCEMRKTSAKIRQKQNEAYSQKDLGQAAFLKCA